jgi:antitoxin (DNA-binding transcriptional repressor) of toxin-antitoxin stability system
MIDAKAKEKILKADLANIVRKVKAGKPLTTTERAIIEPQTSPTAQPPHDAPRLRNPGGGRKRKIDTLAPPEPGQGYLFNAPRSAQKPSAKPPKTASSRLGLAGSIERLQQAERSAYDRYLIVCHEQPDNAEVQGWARKNWLDLAEQLRKIEDTAPDVDAALLRTIPIDDVEREFARMTAAFRQSLENCARSIAAKLVAQGIVPHEKQIAAQETLRLHINETLKMLHSDTWSADTKQRKKP